MTRTVALAKKEAVMETAALVKLFNSLRLLLQNKNFDAGSSGVKQQALQGEEKLL